MSGKTKIFSKKIEYLLNRGQRMTKPKIAFGLATLNRKLLTNLKFGLPYAEIILVGPTAIKSASGFKKIVSTNPEEKIAALLAHNQVEGIIRGTIDDFKTYEAYQRLSGEKSNLNLGLFVSPLGHEFFLGPASNPEGWKKEERLAYALGSARFVQSWGIKPFIAVFTGVRHETYSRRKKIRTGVVGYLNKTHEGAEWIVAKLQKQGFTAKNWAIDLNPAVAAGYNILIPVNGMVGNQIFRVLLFCGGRVLAAPRLGLSHCYEDNSRTETNFLPHIKWLVAWINLKKKKQI